MSLKTQLPNGCYIGKMSVTPPNWDQPNASTKKDWKIHYRFYDPSLKADYPKGLARQVKGMNDHKNLQERQGRTKELKAETLEFLLEGFNPITNAVPDFENLHEITPKTPIFIALEWARLHANIVHQSKLDIKSQLKFLKEAAARLNYSNLMIGEVRRRHIKMLLRNVGEHRPIWNNGRFNKYRANLQNIFKELVEIDAVETNPLNDIKKMADEDKIRETLSREDRRRVDHYLRAKKMVHFRLYIRLFFHTGIRSSELLQVKAKDVNLKDQLVLVTIRKGRKIREVNKTIKTIAVRYWKLALKNCPPDHYIFSWGLKPGALPVNPHQISRRWNTHIKQPVKNGGLGITADFYSFKHGNTTEMIDLQSEEVAAELNSHKNTAMVRKIYDTKRVSREHEKIKLAANEF